MTHTIYYYVIVILNIIILNLLLDFKKLENYLGHRIKSVTIQ